MSEDTDCLIAKAVCMCVLFVSAFTLGVLPMKLFKFNNGDKTVKNMYSEILLCFGGGVLLCTTLLHLLPEVAENLEKIDLTTMINLPTAELLMCLGFFAMYFVEEYVHFYLHRREEQLKKSDTKQTIDNFDHHHHHHDHEEKHVDHSHLIVEDATIVSIRGLLIVLALSIHELFEGLSVGLESSSKNVWYMFGAVAAHKLVISFCIGIELITNNVKNLLIVVYIFTFSVVSPTGIGIGMIIMDKNDEDNSVTTYMSVILQGLASGTLLYVVFFEILQSDRRSGLKQSLAVFIGFVVMTCLTLIESD